MARRATKDTFGVEYLSQITGDPIAIRRRVMAGQLIPDHLEVPDGTFAEEGQRGRALPAVPALARPAAPVPAVTTRTKVKS